MAISIRVDVNKLIADLGGKIDGNEIARFVAVSMLPVVKDRIHTEGKAADDSQIGTYSPGYMVVRTGAYQNADRVKKGKSKGDLKNSGTYTKGFDTKVFGTIVDETSKTGKARPNYNRTSDTKVILSLTRQMENDFSVIDLNNGWGLGYKNGFNYEKSQWAEEKYKKKIFSLSEKEFELATEIATAEIVKRFEQ